MGILDAVVVAGTFLLAGREVAAAIGEPVALTENDVAARSLLTRRDAGRLGILEVLWPGASCVSVGVDMTGLSGWSIKRGRRCRCWKRRAREKEVHVAVAVNCFDGDAKFFPRVSSTVA